MEHRLENENLQLVVKEAGAELCSLKNKETGLEYLWQADPEVWGRHAPLLFPIVGKLKENSYQLNGTSYLLPQHGFARDMPWRYMGREESSLSFRLEETSESLRNYPFRFLLEVRYSLKANSLTIDYRVQNRSEQAMPFSIGMHPGFNCPLVAGDRFEDYYLEFEKRETLEKQLLQDGLRTGMSRLVLQDSKTLPLSRQLFEEDALVFEKMCSDWVALRSRTHSHGVKVSFKGFPYLGIWTKSASSPFVCIEPWFGVADPLQGQSDIRQKEGILLLAPEAEFSCTYSIEIF